MLGIAFTLGFATNIFFGYSRGIYLKPMTEELDGSRLGLSMAFTAVSVVSALSAPFVGRLLDRLPIRGILLAAALWAATGFFTLAMMQTTLQLCIAMALFLGLANAPLGGAGPSKLVVSWFTGRRGLALAISAMGASVAGVCAPPLVAPLVESVGWRETFRLFGAAAIVLLVPLILLVRDGPGARRAASAAGPASREGWPEADADERVWSRGEYLRSRAFWGVLLIFGIMVSVFSAISTHLFAHLTDHGMSGDAAALVLSAMAAVALAVKPLYGWLVDRFDPRVAVALSIATQTLALGLLLVADAFSALVAAAMLFGSGYGGMVPLRNSVTALAFGRMSFAEISGAMRPLQLPLVVIGVPLAGWIHDHFDSYTPAFAAFLVMHLAAASGIVLLRGAARRPGP